MSDDEAHNIGIACELTKHARSLPNDHPDRSTFILESARLRLGRKITDDESFIKNLKEPYDIPHEQIKKKKRQKHVEDENRFVREVLGQK